jgi:hypothetical protein
MTKIRAMLEETSDGQQSNCQRRSSGFLSEPQGVARTVLQKFENPAKSLGQSQGTFQIALEPDCAITNIFGQRTPVLAAATCGLRRPSW